MTTAVIFDMDGVLIERTDRDRLREAVRTAFDGVGVADPADEHVDRLLSDVDPSVVERICEDHGVDPTSFWTERERAAVETQRRAIRDGEKTGYDDLHVLEELSGPLGVVSANQHPTVEFALEHLGIDRHFEAIYGRETSLRGLHRKKPATYYVERALEDLGVESALFVGDSENDVAAARAAGLESVFLRRDHREGYVLDPEPTVELPDMTAVVDWLKTSS